MFIDKDSVVVNGISMGQYILSAKYEYNKLWASDTGRNMARKNGRNINRYISKSNIII